MRIVRFYRYIHWEYGRGRCFPDSNDTMLCYICLLYTSGPNYDLYEIVTVEDGSIFGGPVLKGDAWGYTYTPVASMRLRKGSPRRQDRVLQAHKLRSLPYPRKETFQRPDRPSF